MAHLYIASNVFVRQAFPLHHLSWIKVSWFSDGYLQL
jgi:hypothetical protein